MQLKLITSIQPASTPESTNADTLYKLGYPCSLALYNLCEILDDNTSLDGWRMCYSTYKYNNIGNRLVSSLNMNGENLQVKVDNYNDYAPTVPYVFSSLSAAKYGRKFSKILYYKDKALIQGYAINEDKTQYKEYNLLGKPILNESGTFNQKPTVEQGVGIGFAYFCTDKKTEEGTTNGIMIYHKGSNVWVDALGRVIS